MQDAATWYYDEILYADNGWAYAGAFGDPDFCPYSSSGNDTFAFALDFKVSKGRLRSEGCSVGANFLFVYSPFKDGNYAQRLE